MRKIVGNTMAVVGCVIFVVAAWMIGPITGLITLGTVLVAVGVGLWRLDDVY